MDRQGQGAQGSLEYLIIAAAVLAIAAVVVTVLSGAFSSGSVSAELSEIKADASQCGEIISSELGEPGKMYPGLCKDVCSKWKGKELPFNVTSDAGVDDVYKACLAGKSDWIRRGSSKTASNIAPSVDFSYEPKELYPGDQVSFDGKADDIDGSITSYTWNFGDGEGSTEQDPTHTYDSKGYYDVKLTVTDDNGSSASVTKEVNIGVNEAPSVSNPSPEDGSTGIPYNQSLEMSVEVSDPENDDLNATFHVNGPSNSMEKEVNNVGSGENAVITISKDFLNESTSYDWHVNVTDGYNEVSSSTWSFETAEKDVNNAPQAQFSYSPSNPSPGDELQFTDESTDDKDNIVNYNWDFGDGETSTEQNPTHNYSSKGTYEVTLTVEDGAGNTDNSTRSISVLEGYLLRETFEGQSDGSEPDGWTILNDPRYFDIDTGKSKEGEASLILDGATGVGEHAEGYLPLPDGFTPSRIEFYRYYESGADWGNDGHKTRIRDSSGDIIFRFDVGDDLRDGTIDSLETCGTTVSEGFSADEWVEVTFYNINWNSETYDVKVNHSSGVNTWTDCPFLISASEASQFYLHDKAWSWSGGDKSWIDDIRFR